MTQPAQHLETLQSQGQPLAQPEEQLQALRRLPLATEFATALAQVGLAPLTATGIQVLQLNVGKLCNQTCRHCHVDAGPDRREAMTRETAEACMLALERSHIPTVDITGGAPELNPQFRFLVERSRELGRHVIDRCNLTVIETRAHADLPRYLARHGVEIVASLPHYRQLGTDRQRGTGVFEKSIAALRKLNAVGYGDGQSGLKLHLVTNPVGAYLPGSQASLELEWKRELARLHGVRFDSLFTITNMPVSRFLAWLLETDNLESYLERLVAAFNPAAARAVMCRTTLSVAWDGTLYDCDFNQMLELRAAGNHITQFDERRLGRRPIRVDRHCFGCTAGSGSSCGGATA